AVQHFLRYGWLENRLVSPQFDQAAYLSANPDVADAVRRGEITPLEHLLRYGIIEGRQWEAPDPPVPPLPPDPPQPDDGPATVHHLYPNHEIVARSVDERFVIHVERCQESWIKIHEYREHHIVDLSRIHGLTVFGNDHLLQLEAPRGEYSEGVWKWGKDG